MGGWLYAGHVQRLHVGRVVEHGRQLRGELIEFVVAEAKAGQPGYMGGLVSADSTGHSGNIALEAERIGERMCLHTGEAVARAARERSEQERE